MITNVASTTPAPFRPVPTRLVELLAAVQTWQETYGCPADQIALMRDLGMSGAALSAYAGWAIDVGLCTWFKLGLHKNLALTAIGARALRILLQVRSARGGLPSEQVAPKLTQRASASAIAWLVNRGLLALINGHCSIPDRATERVWAGDGGESGYLLKDGGL